MYEINKSSNPIDYEAINFVRRAMSRDETRQFMMVIHIELYNHQRVAIATDGRRLHYATISQDIQVGNYTLISSKTSIILKPVENITFPDWKRVVPKIGAEMTSIDLNNAGIGKKGNQCAALSQALISLYATTHRVINLSYIDDLSKASWKVYASTGNSTAVVFKRDVSNGEENAIIMPMAQSA